MGRTVAVDRDCHGAVAARMADAFKNSSHWIRVTTKTKDLDEAKEAARDLYMDARHRLMHGIPAKSERFKDVAKLAVDRMQKAIAAGKRKRVCRNDIQDNRQLLVPFFGQHHVDHITCFTHSRVLRCGGSRKCAKS